MLTVVPAGGDLRQAALTLLCCRLEPGEREQQLASLLDSVDRSEFTLDDLLIAVRDGIPVGAVLIVVRPGRMAFLWPPVVHPGESETFVAAQLVVAAAARVDAAGVVVTQCLLELEDSVNRDLLNASGFPYCTDIQLLSRSLADLPDSSNPIGESVTIETYDASREAEFVSVVERTYIDSLDCPEIARYRSGEDALQSYRAAPGFDSSLWCLGSINEKAVGVLLAQDHPERGVREFVYVGTVPEARRQGVGRFLLRRGLGAARDAGMERCEVAVDSGNLFAMNLYRSLGFEEVRRFAVHLRLCRGT